MHQFQVELGASCPIGLVFLTDFKSSAVAFIKTRPVKALFDLKDSEFSAKFYEEFFTIQSSDYEYNTTYEYNTIPEMEAWLKSQNLIYPVF